MVAALDLQRRQEPAEITGITAPAVKTLAKDQEFGQRLIQSVVRMLLSFLGHGGALTAIAYSMFVPEWLAAIFALAITWYFATKEMRGENQMPHWQALFRTTVRAVHALGGAAGLGILFATGHEIPNWWVAIYSSIIAFYFIELRDPPEEISREVDRPDDA